MQHEFLIDSELLMSTLKPAQYAIDIGKRPRYLLTCNRIINGTSSVIYPMRYSCNIQWYRCENPWYCFDRWWYSGDSMRFQWESMIFLRDIVRFLWWYFRDSRDNPLYSCEISWYSSHKPWYSFFKIFLWCTCDVSYFFASWWYSCLNNLIPWYSWFPVMFHDVSWEFVQSKPLTNLI